MWSFSTARTRILDLIQNQSEIETKLLLLTFYKTNLCSVVNFCVVLVVRFSVVQCSVVCVVCGVVVSSLFHLQIVFFFNFQRSAIIWVYLNKHKINFHFDIQVLYCMIYLKLKDYENIFALFVLIGYNSNKSNHFFSNLTKWELCSFNQTIMYPGWIWKRIILILKKLTLM